MKQLGYSKDFNKWIKLYHLAMFNQDKSLNIVVFKVKGEENTECIIFMATNIYSIGMDNFDIKLDIQCNCLISFDKMIQHMGQVEKKGQQSTFLLFTSK